MLRILIILRNFLRVKLNFISCASLQFVTPQHGFSFRSKERKFLMYFISRLFTLVDSLSIEGICIIVFLVVVVLRQDDRCRLIPEYNFSLYTARPNVHFLHVFFLFCIFFHNPKYTLCVFTILCFSDYLTALAIYVSKVKKKKPKKPIALAFPGIFFFSTLVCAGSHSI